MIANIKTGDFIYYQIKSWWKKIAEIFTLGVKIIQKFKR